MSRSTLSLTLLSLILTSTACPPDDVIFPEPDTTGDSSTGDGFSSSGIESSTTAPDESTGDGATTSAGGIGFVCKPIAQVAETRGGLATSCDIHPWADACPSPLATCEDVVLAMLETPACSALTWCDYVECADAMADAECGVRPAACDDLIACINEGP